MTYARQSASYRQMEIHTASPERLVVIVFEQLVVSLERARLAMQRQDIELRVVSLGRARSLVSELLATLDLESGDALANQLADLYQFMLVELVDVGSRQDLVTLGRLIGVASSLRDGFVGAAEQLSATRRKSAA
jgi:flagellar protein FliS